MTQSPHIQIYNYLLPLESTLIGIPCHIRVGNSHQLRTYASELLTEHVLIWHLFNYWENMCVIAWNINVLCIYVDQLDIYNQIVLFISIYN